MGIAAEHITATVSFSAAISPRIASHHDVHPTPPAHRDNRASWKIHRRMIAGGDARATKGQVFVARASPPAILFLVILRTSRAMNRSAIFASGSTDTCRRRGLLFLRGGATIPVRPLCSDAPLPEPPASGRAPPVAPARRPKARRRPLPGPRRGRGIPTSPTRHPRR